MYKIGIDPGHGGSDPGAENKNLNLAEKDIVLEIAGMVESKLKTSGFNVVMTRSGDYRLSEDLGGDLTARANLSNTNNCDAYVSIHMNAFNQSAFGVETYSYNGANTPELARSIHNRVISTGCFSFDRGLKTANYAVLRETDCIAALIEMAFIDNDEDVKHVINNKEVFADAISGGICDYFGVNYQASAVGESKPREELYDMPIMGKQYLDAQTMANYVLSINPSPKINCSMLELATYFLEEGEIEGVRGDIALAQSCKETGYFKYGGQVLPEQNNFAGIGAVNNSATGKGAWFVTPRDGVRAQIQHLKAYASKEDLVGQVIDPRFNLVQRGSSETWVGLGGRWAVPGYDPEKYSSVEEARMFHNDYGSTIIQIYANMKQNYNPPEIAQYPAMDNEADGWAAEAIEWAKKEGYLVGDTDGNLRLHDNITRQEFYAVLKRFADKETK